MQDTLVLQIPLQSIYIGTRLLFFRANLKKELTPNALFVC